MEDSKLKIYAVETNNGVYITPTPDDSRYWNNNSFGSYLFDGKCAENTFKQNWWKLEHSPIKVTHKESQPNINHRFTLINTTIACDRIPLTLTREQALESIENENNKYIWKPEYAMYQTLYEEFSDEQPDIEVENEFEYIVLAIIDNIKEPQKILYPIKENSSFTTKNGTVENKDITHAIIDNIVYPQIVINERPCKLTSKQTYDIVREHVNRNINPKVAVVTSNYDFCFKVEKVIPLGKPYSFQYDNNNSLFDKRKRKPIMKTKYVETKKMVCFEMTSEKDHYEGYTPIKEFNGKNEDDLKEQIDNYLEQLMAFINEPVKECSTCNGVGVLYNSNIEPVTAKD